MLLLGPDLEDAERAEERPEPTASEGTPKYAP
jgi:hypothetical protein